MSITVDDLRRFAVARSLFAPTSLTRALDRLGFVQADPIRAPARAQDLILRHRVRNYCAGDLERLYPTLRIEEDFFVPYGFVTPRIQALMHPRTSGLRPFSAKDAREADLVLEFVRERGEVHPRDVNAHFARGTTRNYWGGQSNATTHLMSQMHYWGMIRVTRRDRGIRVYAVREPVPAPAAVHNARGKARRHPVGVLVSDARAHVDGVDWYWPAGERLRRTAPVDRVRLLAPFDPVVSDRGRFEILWGWAYRFEAYTPARKRERGYYALPLLWRDRVIGWSNIAVKDGRLESDFGYVDSRPPRDRAFRGALDEELDRMRAFLGLKAGT